MLEITTNVGKVWKFDVFGIARSDVRRGGENKEHARTNIFISLVESFIRLIIFY